MEKQQKDNNLHILIIIIIIIIIICYTANRLMCTIQKKNDKNLV